MAYLIQSGARITNFRLILFLQIHHTVSFPEFHVDWMSPEEVYLHRENTSSQIYRGISASLGFKKPSGHRLFRGYRELCQHSGMYARSRVASAWLSFICLLLLLESSITKAIHARPFVRR